MASPRPAPPLREPSYITFAPRRGPIASFENLVALANYQDLVASGSRGAQRARRALWRVRGEPVVELPDLRACLQHAGKGALRAGALAFNIRLGVNLFLLLFRIRRMPRHRRAAAVRAAILGGDPVRFGAMLGSFVFIYKFLLNALPLLFSPDAAPTSASIAASPFADGEPDAPAQRPPLTAERRRTRLSLSASAREAIVRKRTRRWHASTAGALAAAVAVLCEAPERRVAIGQQIFVRGLQGSTNAWSERLGIHVPYGAVWVFALCCGQIMYASLLRPDTLPHWYSSWVATASRVPKEAIRINRDLIRDGVFNPEDASKLIMNPKTTPRNRTHLIRMHAAATAVGSPDFGPPLGQCSAIHHWIDGCATAVPLDRFWSVFRFMFPVYGALHLIPAVLFRMRVFTKNPAKVLARALGGTVRSSAFLGVFVVIYQTLLCGKVNLWLALNALRRDPQNASLAATLARLIPRPLVFLLRSKLSFYVLGLCSGLALLLEEPRRRGELTMYVLPKALESTWAMARGRGYVPPARGWVGEAVLSGAGGAMVMATYQNDPQHLSGLVRKVIYQFIGPN